MDDGSADGRSFPWRVLEPMPAVAGYPNITVPMGEVRDPPGRPVDSSGRHGRATLIALAYAYEQRTKARTAPQFFAHAPLSMRYTLIQV